MAFSKLPLMSICTPSYLVACILIFHVPKKSICRLLSPQATLISSSNCIKLSLPWLLLHSSGFCLPALFGAMKSIGIIIA